MLLGGKTIFPRVIVENLLRIVTGNKNNENNSVRVSQKWAGTGSESLQADSDGRPMIYSLIDDALQLSKSLSSKPCNWSSTL